MRRVAVSLASSRRFLVIASGYVGAEEGDVAVFVELNGIEPSAS